MWRAILIVYRELDVRLRRRHYHHLATEQEIADATKSFRAFPGLASRLTDGAARVHAHVVTSKEPLVSLSPHGKEAFWPAPKDTRRELDRFAPAGTHDSVFVFWPQHDFATGSSVPGWAWGLGMGANDETNGATYAVVANAPTQSWEREAAGEVWLHEWLHGVCHHFELRGHQMPERNADGAELHGYERSGKAGWSDYYRDLMSANVTEAGRQLGIPRAAWSQDLTERA